MGWMSETFKKDKRFLELQLKRGHIKRKDIATILNDLPDVSDKVDLVPAESKPLQKTETEEE